ncbi:hypothetical protein B0H13DRAFT_1912338 [Mycena leptocephala]|nr:hypothetical protein B0H13DRAFT_1912338 [Mycena leptocephala]
MIPQASKWSTPAGRSHPDVFLAPLAARESKEEFHSSTVTSHRLGYHDWSWFRQSRPISSSISNTDFTPDLVIIPYVHVSALLRYVCECSIGLNLYYPRLTARIPHLLYTINVLVSFLTTRVDSVPRRKFRSPAIKIPVLQFSMTFMHPVQTVPSLMQIYLRYDMFMIFAVDTTPPPLRRAGVGAKSTTVS